MTSALSKEKTWFLVPNTHCPSENGPIALGIIVQDPLNAENALTREAVPIEPNQVDTMDFYDYTEILRKQKRRSGSIWLHFIDYVTFQISGSSDQSLERLATFDRLETRRFRPDEEYIRQSIELPEVRKYLSSTGRRKKPLYMITAVKIAYGATIQEVASRAREGGAAASVDGTAATGAPMSVGASFSQGTEDGMATAHTQKKPFVFLYQLRQIQIKKGEYENDKPYTSGALYGIGSNGENSHQTTGTETAGDSIVWARLDEDELTADDVGGESLEVGDDGSDEDGVCELIMPASSK
ncbi:unnamed protein product [Clonostachys rosea]|uniref:Uncharacterized protein n=1 Tax=Bionectria ochroleuca TaxID=29856 RepID=A0ABY6V3F0_BIOOC|nr:unnamed protein product [Clonostachys rosea]